MIVLLMDGVLMPYDVGFEGIEKKELATDTTIRLASQPMLSCAKSMHQNKLRNADVAK